MNYDRNEGDKASPQSCSTEHPHAADYELKQLCGL